MIIEIITAIAKTIDLIAATSLQSAVEKIEKKTSEIRAQGDLEVVKVLAPAKLDAAQEHTKQALLRATEAKMARHSNNTALYLGLGGLIIIVILLYIYYKSGSKK